LNPYSPGWRKRDIHTRAPKILAVLEKAKTSWFSSLGVLRKANVGTVYKYGHLIRRTIDQLGKLDFYQQHFDMVELRFESGQSEGLK
jgi:hypothetical protein